MAAVGILRRVQAFPGRLAVEANPVEIRSSPQPTRQQLSRVAAQVVRREAFISLSPRVRPLRPLRSARSVRDAQCDRDVLLCAFVRIAGRSFAPLFALLVASPSARADFEAGGGVAAGGAAYRGSTGGPREFEPVVSPLLAFKWDPFDARLRPTFGLASLPTYSYSMGYDASTTPWIVGELGLAYGSPHHRIALVGHAGFFSFGAGVHYALLPIKLGDRVRMGPEVRAMWMAREAGYVGVAWTFRFSSQNE